MIGFESALAFTLKQEGGYVNHPSDPGGATNQGITQSTFTAWQRAKRLVVRAVATITRKEVEDIYYARYWKAAGCDRLNSERLAACLFDYAVNSGVKRAVMELQRRVGVPADGIIGPVTLKATNAGTRTQGLEDQIIAEYLRARLRFLRGLRTWSTFGRGWTNRINALAEHVGVKL